MTSEKLILRHDYWKNINIQQSDIDFLYNYLLETETPQTSFELIGVLISKRIQQEVELAKRRQLGDKNTYLPKNHYQVNQVLAFPALGWQQGEILLDRQGYNPELPPFNVIKIKFDNGELREFATDLDEHVLNNPPEITLDDESLNSEYILSTHQENLTQKLQNELINNPDFVLVADRWFPKALLIDINIGHLNIAEATLDMGNGGPLPTPSIMEHLDINKGNNSKLAQFSLDYALQEDKRFDEVGPAGEMLWFLKHLEPKDVLETPLFLRYQPDEYDRSVLTNDMLALEQRLADELTPTFEETQDTEKVELRLLFPHWRTGTIPLSYFAKKIFPTAYEAPHIRFWLVDGNTKDKFPAWVVRKEGYVYGLSEWYNTRGLIPGSIIRLRKSTNRGEVIIQTSNQRSSRDYVRSILIGSDGGIVFGPLRQVIKAEYDERMAMFLSDIEGLDEIWQNAQKSRNSLESIMMNMIRNLTKLTPQGHVHASELYAAVNLVRRCPPGPILALLTTRPQFVHVGDMYYHLKD